MQLLAILFVFLFSSTLSFAQESSIGDCVAPNSAALQQALTELWYFRFSCGDVCDFSSKQEETSIYAQLCEDENGVIIYWSTWSEVMSTSSSFDDSISGTGLSSSGCSLNFPVCNPKICNGIDTRVTIDQTSGGKTKTSTIVFPDGTVTTTSSERLTTELLSEAFCGEVFPECHFIAGVDLNQASIEIIAAVGSISCGLLCFDYSINQEGNSIYAQLCEEANGFIYYYSTSLSTDGVKTSCSLNSPTCGMKTCNGVDGRDQYDGNVPSVSTTSGSDGSKITITILISNTLQGEEFCATSFLPSTPSLPPTMPAPTALPPTFAPTILPPTLAPTTLPPIFAPISLPPTLAPISLPSTLAPTTLPPTFAPTTLPPTLAPTTLSPTLAPTTLPPTLAPTTLPPTFAPTTLPPTSSGICFSGDCLLLVSLLAWCLLRLF